MWGPNRLVAMAPREGDRPVSHSHDPEGKAGVGMHRRGSFGYGNSPDWGVGWWRERSSPKLSIVDSK